ncbi:MFS transporter [Actinopolyspora erythraea]|uniref:MFS transporter n=1 Tax=Actinopolyspora erythraea TaxID=414996 RepID=UPI000693EECB|nr:MFS transporter [Actinopolyspora erythraea]
MLDKLPRRVVLCGGLVVFTVANAAAALAPNYWTLMAARIVAALAAAGVTSAAFATATAGAPEGRQGSYLSVVTAGMTVALFTGVPLGTLLGGTHGWRATFWLIAAVGAMARSPRPRWVAARTFERACCSSSGCSGWWELCSEDG